jgi:hypothetical protein
MAFLGAQHKAAEGDNSRAIQIEADDGGAACGSKADQLREVLVPAKVVAPVISARVVEGHDGSCSRVGAFGKGALGAVATEACQRKILQRVRPAESQRLDVVNGERAGGTRGWSEAVLTPAVGTAENLLTTPLGQVTAHVSDNPRRTDTKFVHESAIANPAQLGQSQNIREAPGIVLLAQASKDSKTLSFRIGERACTTLGNQ